MSKKEISEELVRNFHIFWDNFPFPVMLTHRDRTILHINRAAATAGYAAGTRCIDLGAKENHRRCMANQALQEQTAKRLVAYSEALGLVVDGYWVPLAGEKDLFLHFFADITAYAAEHMFQEKECGESSGCGSCGGA